MNLQWKIDWSMRWSALDINYEMNGKDLIPSFELSKQIAKFINKKVPVNIPYEFFLIKMEKKFQSLREIIYIDEWLKYGTKESLAYFMYVHPRKSK